VCGQELDFLFNQFQVLRVDIEAVSVIAPELLIVHSGPLEVLLVDLLLPLFEAAELLVALFKSGFELLEHFEDLFVNPDAILQLHHDCHRINHRQLVHAFLIVHQALEEHEGDADDLLFVVVIEDFADILEDHQLEVPEVLQREVVEGNNPEDGERVVRKLVLLVLDAVDEPALQFVEAISLLHKDIRQFVVLHELHQAGGSALVRHQLLVIVLQQPGHEVK